MPDKKIIAVVGATGAQGGGLARAILNDHDGPFRLRAITRNPASEKAAELARLGARGGRGRPGRRREPEAGVPRRVRRLLRHQLLGALLAREGDRAGREHGRGCKAAGLQHVIWSTLEDTRKWVPLSDNRMPTLKEKYKVPHFDAKGEANKEFTSRGVPTTLLLTSFYWDNFIYFGLGPKRGPDGVLAITLPWATSSCRALPPRTSGSAPTASSREAVSTSARPSVSAGGHLTGGEMAAALGRGLGQEVRYNEVTPDVYRSFGFPGADDLGSMFQFKRDFNDYYVGARDLATARALNPSLQSFDEWVTRHKGQIPIE